MATPEQSPTTSVSPPRPAPGPRPIVLVIGGPIARADVQGLCARIRALLEGSDAAPVVCDVGALIHPDAVTIDALARLQLAARRLGRDLRLRHASRDLQELLAFLGLDDVMPLSAESRLGPKGQAEEREQGRGVEEEGDPGDPPA
ncbi:MAG: STAS domain-containing protein [Actinomycetota bacterium]